jgi:WD40 repeat protein
MSNHGFQLWSAIGDNMIFFYQLNSLAGFESLNEDAFMIGITVTSNFICVGTSIGSVLVFNVSKGGNDFFLTHNLETDVSIPLSCLSSTSTLLVAANDRGKLFGYRVEHAFEQIFIFPSSSSASPCTSIFQNEDVLFASFASGHLRIYRTDIMELVIEVAAHTRPITAMAFFCEDNLIATVGQDQILNVWNVPDFKSTSNNSAMMEVSLLESHLVEDKILCGVVFLNDSKICIAAYDEDQLVIFEKY